MSIIINTHLKLMLLKQQKDFSKNYENLSNLIEKKLSMIQNEAINGKKESFYYGQKSTL